ncbi:response regulator transcription factor [Stenotrophomonas sp. Iso1]|uniref:response regulator transcription factor n=1 Tax=Stenotrophomonas sp. Iso1 TaxID=2977283 RepID=UPI0022B7BF7D|nr:response regulator transcription factor [Stenotrophomonas sp. Iso1]
MRVKWSVVKPLRISVLDDHSLIQLAMKTRLSREADFAVVGIYANSRDMFALMPAVAPDLLIMDYVLADTEMDGLHLLGLIRRRFPGLCILVSSSTEKPSLVNLMLNGGANGFFGKSEDAELLIDAVRNVAAGETYVSPALQHALGRSPGLYIPQDGERIEDGQQLLDHAALSPREREVLRCCLDGMSVSQIARKFQRSTKTISGQKQSAYRKLGICTDAELFKLQSSLVVNTP